MLFVVKLGDLNDTFEFFMAWTEQEYAAHLIKERARNSSKLVLKQNDNNLSSDNALPDSKQRQRAQTLARGDEGEASRPGLLHCRFTLHRKSLLDVDAKYASVKDLLDCVVTSGIVCGDKEGQITLEVRQRKISKGEVETTEIEILTL